MAFVRWLHPWDPWADIRRVWAPFAEMRRLQEAMDKAFEDVWPTRRSRVRMAMPRVNVGETGDSVVVTAEVPGVKPEDISLSITGNTLTLKGSRKPATDEKDVTYHRRERVFGDFSRSIELPDMVESDKAEAEFDQGILTIRIPKTAEAKPRQIAVKVN